MECDGPVPEDGQLLRNHFCRLQCHSVMDCAGQQHHFSCPGLHTCLQTHTHTHTHKHTHTHTHTHCHSFWLCHVFLNSSGFGFDFLTPAPSQANVQGYVSFGFANNSDTTGCEGCPMYGGKGGLSVSMLAMNFFFFLTKPPSNLLLAKLPGPGFADFYVVGYTTTSTDQCYLGCVIDTYSR